jgi:hypothetical protein
MLGSHLFSFEEFPLNSMEHANNNLQVFIKLVHELVFKNAIVALVLYQTKDK